jgi:outer membrane lipoprotein SlyB
MNPKLIIAAAALLGACTTVPQKHDPNFSLVDPARTNMVAYQADFEDCSRLANQSDVGASAAGGAVVGAIIGGLIGAVICGADCAAWGAGLTGAHGAASGARGARVDQQTAIRGCLSGRGYYIIR